jgi:hypothetical protein
MEETLGEMGRQQRTAMQTKWKKEREGTMIAAPGCWRPDGFTSPGVKSHT